MITLACTLMPLHLFSPCAQYFLCWFQDVSSCASQYLKYASMRCEPEDIIAGIQADSLKYVYSQLKLTLFERYVVMLTIFFIIIYIYFGQWLSCESKCGWSIRRFRLNIVFLCLSLEALILLPWETTILSSSLVPLCMHEGFLLFLFSVFLSELISQCK